ncbi:MAG: nucleotidyltransferase family protein [Candidatus Altiarchaeota archaeon]
MASITNLTREQTLILTLINGDEKAILESRGKLEDGVNWEWMLKFSANNMIVPILYQRLKGCESKDVSGHVIQKLRVQTAYTSMKNILIEKDVRTVLTALNEKKLDVILLKGLMLQEKVYANNIVRQMADVDLLIREGDLDKVENVLYKNGFTFDTNTLDIGRTSREACLKNGDRDFPYIKKSTGTKIELRWHFLEQYDPFKIKMEEIWRRAEKTRICGTDTLILSPEDLVIYQCLHLSYKHIYYSTPFRGLMDVSESVKRYSKELDWNRLAKTCKEWEVASFVYHPLKLAKELMNAPVPDETLNFLEKNSSKIQLISQEYIAKRNLFKTESSYRMDSILYVSLRLLWTDNIHDKFRIIKRVVPKMFRDV